MTDPSGDDETNRQDDEVTKRYQALKRELARQLKAKELPRDEWVRQRDALDVAEERERLARGLAPRRLAQLRREGRLEEPA